MLLRKEPTRSLDSFHQYSVPFPGARRKLNAKKDICYQTKTERNPPHCFPKNNDCASADHYHHYFDILNLSYSRVFNRSTKIRLIYNLYHHLAIPEYLNVILLWFKMSLAFCVGPFKFCILNI